MRFGRGAGQHAQGGAGAEELARLALDVVHSSAAAFTPLYPDEMPLAQMVAERTGARVATISVMAGGLPGTSGYLDSTEANLKALVEAVRAAAAH